MGEKVCGLRIGGTRALQRMLSLAVCAAMVIAMVPVTARAAVVANGNCGAVGDGSNVTWSLDDSGVLTISGTGEMADYVTNESIGTIPPWSSNEVTISSVVIDEGVTTIGDCAFYGPLNSDIKAKYTFTSIQIPASVTTIGGSAFRNSALGSVTFPSNSKLTTIGGSAFRETMLSGGGFIAIPKTVTTIDNQAFNADGGGGSMSVTFLGDPPSDINNEAFMAMTLTCRYPYGNAAWDSKPNLGEYNATWTPYGDTAVSVGDVTKEGDGMKLTLTSSKIPFKNTSDWPSDLSKVFMVQAEPGSNPLTFGSAALSTDKMSVTLTLGNPGAEELTQGTFPILLDSQIFAAELADSNGTSISGTTIQVVYNFEEQPPEPDDPITPPVALAKMTASPGTVTPKDGKAQVTFRMDAGNVRFYDEDLTNYAASSDTSTAYRITAVKLSSDRRSATMTIEAQGTVESGTVSVQVKKVEVAEGTTTVDIRAAGGTVRIVKLADTTSGTGGGSPRPAVTPGGPETIPLPDGIAAPPKTDPPSPIQDIVKKDKLYTEYVDWIERVTPPAFAADLYDVLVAGSDETDTRFSDCLMEDKYFTIDPNVDGSANAAVETVEEVEFDMSALYASDTGSLSSVIFENDDFFIVDVTRGDRGVNYRTLTLGDVVRTSAYNGVFVVSVPKGKDFDEKKKETCSYIAAVFQAFDRDHPEVFWLSGKCKVRIASVGGQAYFFLSLADTKGFTMRAPDWTAPGAVADGLRRREEAVTRILRTLEGADTSAEQLRALNKYLTEHNAYNSSADLDAVGNEPHECLSALEGRTGETGPVCDGYSRAFKVLCDRAGIPCVLENGYARTSPGAGGTFHMWNSVELGGSWFGVDVTWNDPAVRGVTAARSGHENEQYLLVGADTSIRGMTFSSSHPVTNQAAVGGVAFNNGPALSPVAFSALSAQSGLSVGAMGFDDVPIWEWFANSVAWACERGLMVGVSDTCFAPNTPLTREQLWMLLCRVDGQQPRELEDARQWAMMQELTDGTIPLEAVTREQLVVTMYRYCKRKGYRMDKRADLSRFPDSAQLGVYAREAFAWAVGCGLVDGTDQGLLAPQSGATRAQMSAILQRFDQSVREK